MTNLRKFKLHDGQTGAAVSIRVITAKTNKIHKIGEDGTVEVNLAGKTAEVNDLLKNFLSSVLGIPSSQIDIIAGENGPKKLVSIIGLTADDVDRQLRRSL